MSTSSTFTTQAILNFWFVFWVVNAEASKCRICFGRFLPSCWRWVSLMSDRSDWSGLDPFMMKWVADSGTRFGQTLLLWHIFKVFGKRAALYKYSVKNWTYLGIYNAIWANFIITNGPNMQQSICHSGHTGGWQNLSNNMLTSNED